MQFNNSKDALIQAAYEGDLDTVEWELKNKTDPDSKGSFECLLNIDDNCDYIETTAPALTAAIYKRHWKIVATLLSYQATITQSDIAQTLVLTRSTESLPYLFPHSGSHIFLDTLKDECASAPEESYAAAEEDDSDSAYEVENILLSRLKSGMTSLMKVIVEGEPLNDCMQVNDLDETDSIGWTALHWAVYCEDEDAVQFLIQKGANLNYSAKSWGLTPLHLAVNLGEENIVCILLQQDIMANKLDWCGRTPLICACQQNNSSIASLLLEYEKTHHIHEDLAELYQSAFVNKNFDMMTLLVEYGADVNSEIFGQTALHLAVQENNLPAVNQLLKLNANIDSANHYGTTPLESAIYLGYDAIACFLLQQGANVNTSNVPLVQACQRGDIALVKSLLSHHAAVNQQNPGGKTALMEAIISKSLPIIQELLAHPIQANIQDSSGKTALMYAVENGDASIIQLLLTHGANVNIGDRNGLYPLTVAIRDGKVSAVKLLLESGAQVENSNFIEGKALVLYAAEKGYWPIVKYLIEYGANLNMLYPDGQTLLMKASIAGEIEIVNLLLSHHVDINVKDIKQRNALILALENQQWNIAQALIRAHADVSSTNEEGKTPLMYLSANEKLEMMNALFLLSVDVNVVDNYKRTALHFALQKKCWKAAHLLIKNGADVNVKDSQGLTPLMYACADNQQDLILLLLKCHVDINARDNAGQTALLFAASNKHWDVLKLLLENGANVNIADNSGWTALMSVCLAGELSVAELLFQYGAEQSINAKDNREFDALCCAKISKNKALIDLLLSYIE